MNRRLALLLMPLALACGEEASRFRMTLDVLNPTPLTFEGSGGALGAGVEFRVQGLEEGRELIVESACQGRLCGEYAEQDPGRCGVASRTVAPESGFRLAWDGRYFPRSMDVFGECLGSPRAVPPGPPVDVTVCGRLLGPDVRAPALQCQTTRLELAAAEGDLQISVNVPGAPEERAAE